MEAMSDFLSPAPLFQKAIAETRAIGLDVLQASPREVEAGLALHEDALVVEPYSLGIYAPQDWVKLREAQDAGASSEELRDMTEENGMLGHLEDEASRQNYRLAWETAGVNCIFQGAGEEGNDPARLLKRLARYTHLIDAMPELLDRVSSVEDIRRSHAKGRRAMSLGLNGVPLAGGQKNVAEELGFIRVFAQLGARIMHLTYNRRNAIGDGCGEANDGGLSTFGHDAVDEMNRQGVIIDLAHTGWKTSLDAAKASRHPVVVSHSAAWALHEHIRCKPDDVIRAVVETGGVVCVTNVPAFLGGSGDISAMLDHIEYLTGKFGVDFVGIGTDKVCSLPSPVPPDPTVKIKTRTPWESLWPAGSPSHDQRWNQPRQVRSMAWLNWPLFTVGLVQRGYSEADIRKIVGGNILRVAEAVWKPSTSPG